MAGVNNIEQEVDSLCKLHPLKCLSWKAVDLNLTQGRFA